MTKEASVKVVSCGSIGGYELWERHSWKMSSSQQGRGGEAKKSNLFTEKELLQFSCEVSEEENFEK